MAQWVIEKPFQSEPRPRNIPVNRFGGVNQSLPHKQAVADSRNEPPLAAGLGLPHLGSPGAGDGSAT